jgi:hypothetical protein
MYQRYSTSKIKNIKKSFIFCCNIFRISIALCIPILYKIYISEYIKSNFHVSFQIKFLENYIPYLKEVYSSLFNKYKLQIVIPLLMIYNYCNIYKTFILLISLQYPLILSQILNIYLINRINNKAEINNELIYTTGYTLILWEILFNSDTDEKIHYSIKSIDSIRKGPNINKFSLFLITIFISILHFINFILFNNIENILFDLIIGLTLYYIFFKIFELDPNNPRQFQNFVDFSLFYFILFTFIINLFFIIFTINVSNNYPNKEEIIQNIIYKYSFSSIIIGIFFGAKYEYNFYFEKRFGNWAQYNFEFDGEIAEEDESLASSISFNKARQWNHTNFCISLIRLFFIFLLSFTCLYPFLNITSDNFYQNLIVNNIIPWNILGFGLFHLFKLVLKYFKVTNMLLLTIIKERESF